MNDERKDDARDDTRDPRVPALGRRDLMKLGAGLVVTALNAPKVAASMTTNGAGTRRETFGHSTSTAKQAMPSHTDGQ